MATLTLPFLPPPKPVSTNLAAAMRAVRTAAPLASALGYSEGLADAVASSGLALDALLAPRAGLPRLAAALEGASLEFVGVIIKFVEAYGK